MNTTRQTFVARISAVALSVFATLSMLSGIDTLAQRTVVVDSLMAQSNADAAQRS
jgi:hypothetical protein